MNRAITLPLIRHLILGAALLLTACSRPAPPAAEKPAAPPATAARELMALAQATPGQFQPVPLPDPKIPGYKFPETEDTIVNWTKTNNFDAMNLHAWGIWTALNQITDQTFDNQKLRVFETWYDPTDLASAPTITALEPLLRQPRRLQIPRQFEHGGAHRLTAAADMIGSPAVQVLVKYDPTASQHILANSLFSSAKLTTLLNTDHKPSVPDFPVTAVSLKPVFVTLSASTLKQGRYFQLKAWPGPPPMTFNKTDGLWHSVPFPQSQWGQCVWIDTQGTAQSPGTTVDRTCAADGSSRTVASTYGIDEFIHFRVTAANADLINAQTKQLALTSAPKAVAGDYAVLVAMHVTSREITRWTWQTFWWSYNADQPAAPSSDAIAQARPAQLTLPASHYTHCVGYDELTPPQPASGGRNQGDSLYCYNPYLEAPFDASVLPDSQPGMTKIKGQPVKTANDVGVQTNCMSCHEQANFNPNNVKPAPDYTGDRYVDLTGPAFNGVLKVDFLWSIPGNAK